MCLFSTQFAYAQKAIEQLYKETPENFQLTIPAVSYPEDENTKGIGGDGSAQYNVPGSYVKAANAAYRHYDNYITLYNMPSPHPMNWTTLETLAKSYVINFASVKLTNQTHAIGHVAFEIGCKLPDGSKKLVATGQVPSNGMGGFADQVKDGAGYSAFFGYVPGRLQLRKDLENELDTLTNQEKEVNFLTIKVSNESCLEAQRYIKAYDDEKVSSRYGLGVRPLYGEGGGCANVGVSVVEVMGPDNFKELSKPWSRTFYIPNELLGSESNGVGIGTISLYRKYKWANKTSKPHKVLFFYDPDLMYDWVNAKISSIPAKNRYKINKSAGFTLDYTNSTHPTGWWKK